MFEELTYEQCVVQGIGPLVFPDRLAQGIVSPEERIQMKAVCVHNMQTQAQIYRIQERAWRALEEAGIEAILMKGAGLATLYPSPEMRQWGDVDLYVGKEQYHPACAAMRKAFPDALKFDEELDHYKHYNLIADGVSIEVHRVTIAMTHPLDKRRYEKMEEYGRAHACALQIADLGFKIFEPTFNALFVFLHAWEHMLTKGANLRQICDLSLLLHHYADAIDRPRLERWLRSLHMTEIWQLYMRICVQYMGLPEAEAPGCEGLRGTGYGLRGADDASRFMSILLEGRKNTPEEAEKSHYANRFVRKWHTMKSRMRHIEWVAPFSPAYVRHMRIGIILSGLGRLFAKDRHWE